jgi:hypothetical protein
MTISDITVTFDETLELYHSETDKSPNYFAFDKKVAENYIKEDPTKQYIYILLCCWSQCGFHHPELYVYDSSIIIHKTHVMKGSGVIYTSAALVICKRD